MTFADKTEITEEEVLQLTLSQDFGDVTTLFPARNWLEKACKENGAEITGAGMGFGGADVDIILNGQNFTVTIKPWEKL